MIQHEYLVMWKRREVISSWLGTLQKLAKQSDARTRSNWKAVVYCALADLQKNGDVTLPNLYKAVAANAPQNLVSNTNWQAKIRQILQLDARFINISRGQWKLAA